MERISPQAWKSDSSSIQGQKPDLFPLSLSYPEMLLKLIVSIWHGLLEVLAYFKPDWHPPQLKAAFKVRKSCWDFWM